MGEQALRDGWACPVVAIELLDGVACIIRGLEYNDTGPLGTGIRCTCLSSAVSDLIIMSGSQGWILLTSLRSDNHGALLSLFPGRGSEAAC